MRCPSCGSENPAGKRFAVIVADRWQTAVLAEIYDWFSEGFDTADLQDAKELLDQLNDSSR